MATNKYTIGILIVVLLAASIYVISPDNNVRIDVKGTYSEFKVLQDGKWVLGGEERTILMDGAAKMRASSRVVNSTIDLENNLTTIYRYSFFKNNIVTIDTYKFDGNENSVELFPISHTIQVLNAKTAQSELNKNTEFILVYEVSKLGYYGKTNSNLGQSHEFDRNMKVEWDKGNYYGRVYKYADRDEGKLEIKYRVNSNDFSVDARLFDPIINQDKVFTELIEIKSDILNGEAIFKINNPVDNLEVNDLFFTFFVYEGEGIKQIRTYEIKEVVTEVPIYESIPREVKCDINETNVTNETKSLQEPCYEYDQIQNGTRKQIDIIEEEIKTLSKGFHTIKVVFDYQKAGKNKVEWFPNLYLSTKKYSIPHDMFGSLEDKHLIQDKW